MIVKHKDQLAGTSRTLTTADFSTIRFLLREDGVGLAMTDVKYHANVDATYRYKNHVKVVYCLEGEATLEDLETGEVHHIRPGTLWALPNHEQVRYVSLTPTRLISIFVPALAGPEVHDEEGSFPLL